MKFRLLSCWLLAACVLPLRAADEAPTVKKDKPGPVNWLLRHAPFLKPGGKKAKGTEWKGLAMTLNVIPAKVKLPGTKQLEISVQLANKGKTLVQLDFPTSQRFEVVVKNSAGKLIEQWSEDQAFTNEPSLVTINPGERLDYTANVSTRDMAAGQAYTVEAFFPNYDALRATKAVAAEK